MSTEDEKVIVQFVEEEENGEVGASIEIEADLSMNVESTLNNDDEGEEPAEVEGEGEGQLYGEGFIGYIGQVRLGKWTEEEDEILRNAVHEYGGKNWRKISSKIDGRTDVQCLHRWQKVLRPGLIKGPWSKEVRSTLLLSFINLYTYHTYISDMCDRRMIW